MLFGVSGLLLLLLAGVTCAHACVRGGWGGGAGVCVGVRGGVGELFNTINWVCLWVWLYPGVKPYI